MVLIPGLWDQWGLSYFIELTDSKGERRKVLFDTANDPWPFLYNIDKLGINMDGLDAIVLSHGHHDHTVATVDVLEMSGGCPVYAHPHCFLPRFYKSRDGKLRRGGVPEEHGITEIEKAGGKIILTPDPVEIVPGL